MGAFVGRVGELAALGEIGDVARQGGVRAAVIVGDPGSGKSRLLTEAAARIALPRQFHLVGFEPEAEVPFAAASELLRALTAEGPEGRRLQDVVFGTAPKDASPLEPLRI